MRLFCWNINALLPTEANFRHTYGSFKGFLQEEKRADIACFQVLSQLVVIKLQAMTPASLACRRQRSENSQPP